MADGAQDAALEQLMEIAYNACEECDVDAGSLNRKITNKVDQLVGAPAVNSFAEAAEKIAQGTPLTEEERTLVGVNLSGSMKAYADLWRVARPDGMDFLIGQLSGYARDRADELGGVQAGGRRRRSHRKSRRVQRKGRKTRGRRA